MQARTSYGSRSVCMSVCLSNAWIVTKWKKYLSRFFFVPYERSLSLDFGEEEWLVRGDTFYLKFLVKLTPLERNSLEAPQR